MTKKKTKKKKKKKQDGAATCAQVHRLSVILGIYSICSGILLLELCMDTHQ